MKKEQSELLNFWAHTIRAGGVRPSDLAVELMSADICGSHSTDGEQTEPYSLTSSDEKQIIYIGQGYINGEYSEYQILCPYCKTDKIARDGSRMGDTKFKCKNEKCEKKYFYLSVSVKNHIRGIVAPVAIWLTKNNYPKKYIQQVCGISARKLRNWVKGYDRMDDEKKTAYWESLTVRNLQFDV